MDAGVYSDALYGDLTLALEDERLVLRRHTGYVGDLAHWHHDTFEVRWRDRVLGTHLVTFRLSASGAVASLELEGWADFDRVPEEEAEAR